MKDRGRHLTLGKGNSGRFHQTVTNSLVLYLPKNVHASSWRSGSLRESYSDGEKHGERFSRSIESRSQTAKTVPYFRPFSRFWRMVRPFSHRALPQREDRQPGRSRDSSDRRKGDLSARAFHDRRAVILRSIEQRKLTSPSATASRPASPIASLARPLSRYRPKRPREPDRGREKGLEPLAPDHGSTSRRSAGCCRVGIRQRRKECRFALARTRSSISLLKPSPSIWVSARRGTRGLCQKRRAPCRGDREREEERRQTAKFSRTTTRTPNRWQKRAPIGCARFDEDSRRSSKVENRYRVGSDCGIRSPKI